MARLKSASSRILLALPTLLLYLCVWLCVWLPAGADARQSNRLIRQGISLHNAGHFEQAIQLYLAAYKEDPSLTKALLLIGASYLNLGHAEEVLDYYERYDRQEKDLRIEERERLNQYYDEAAAKLQRDYEAGPPGVRVELLLFVGRAHHDRGRIEQALDYYERFDKAVPPGDPRRERLRGYYEQALRELEQRFQEQKQPELLLLLARVSTDLGQKDEAARYQERYRQLRPPPSSPRRPPVVAPAPPPRIPRRRPVWRVATGAVLGGLGLGVAGLGISALAVDGQCIQPPGQTCKLDFATMGVGAGLLVSGLIAAAGGAALALVPAPRPGNRPRIGLGLGAGSGLTLATEF